MITRTEICQELRIESKTLDRYLNFIAYPEPSAHSFDINVAQAVEKLHDLTAKGFSLREIKDLIHCSEKFCHIIPELQEFLQLSESINLRETIESYDQIFQEFSSREEQYRYRIQELESQIRNMQAGFDELNFQTRPSLKAHPAIDIDALLKKKERETSIKYQKEILELKKQVEYMLENQEQKWLKRNFRSPSASR